MSLRVASEGLVLVGLKESPPHWLQAGGCGGCSGRDTDGGGVSSLGRGG